MKQNEQFNVHPIWLDKHNVPLLPSGIYTVSISFPLEFPNLSSKAINHLIVPSEDFCSVTIFGLCNVYISVSYTHLTLPTNREV